MFFINFMLSMRTLSYIGWSAKNTFISRLFQDTTAIDKILVRFNFLTSKQIA